MSDKPKTFKKAYADINEMSLAQVDEILAIQDKQVTKFSRIKTCEKLWNAAIESMQEEIDKRDVRIKELEDALSMFTDQKSSSFPNGEMISMHGGNGNGQYICEYKYETIEKARGVLGKIKRTKRGER